MRVNDFSWTFPLNHFNRKEIFLEKLKSLMKSEKEINFHIIIWITFHFININYHFILKEEKNDGEQSSAVTLKEKLLHCAIFSRHVSA